MTQDAESLLAAEEAAAQAAEPAPRRRRRRQRRGGVAAGLALLACAMSGAALVVALQPAPPVEVVLPPPAVPLASDAPLPVIGIELLLPHLGRTAPFPRAYAVARALALGDAELLAALAPLSRAAAEGAPSARQLAEEFAAAADAAVLAEMGFRSDAGWLMRQAAATMRLGASLGSGTTPALQAIGAAGEAMRAGDLVAAEAALRALPPTVAAAMAPWRAALDRRLAADAAAARLPQLSTLRAALLIPQMTASR